MRAWAFWLVVIATVLLGLTGITSAALWDFHGHQLIRELAQALGGALFIAGFLQCVYRVAERHVYGEAFLQLVGRK
jgi:hypothetical protein